MTAFVVLELKTEFGDGPHVVVHTQRVNNRIGERLRLLPAPIFQFSAPTDYSEIFENAVNVIEFSCFCLCSQKYGLEFHGVRCYMTNRSSSTVL